LRFRPTDFRGVSSHMREPPGQPRDCIVSCKCGSTFIEPIPAPNWCLRRTLTSEQADIMRLAIANHCKARKLLRAWEAQTRHLIELKVLK